MKKKSIILLLLFIGAFIYLLMCLFINNDYAYSNGELALDNLILTSDKYLLALE